MMELRDYQQTAIDRLKEALLQGSKRPVVQAPTGAGKCLGIGTPVLLYDGSIVPVENILAGDLLMGPDSQPGRVLSTCRGSGELFRIIPTKGDPWVCNDVHVLTLVETESGRVIDIPLNQYLTKTKTFKHVHKMFAPDYGVQFPYREDPSAIPYFLGYWIGDGTKSLVGIGVSSIDPEVLEECNRVASLYGAHVRTDGITCPTHHIVTPRGQPNPLLNEMRNLMGDGDIPQTMLTASREYRFQLLAGILDADGHLANGIFEIAQKSVAYATGIAFLARSLGFKVTQSIKTVNGTDYVRMCISGDLSRIPNRLPRKQAGPRRQIKNPLRTGFKVEPIGVGEYAGFELDGDGRFLLGDFTVTHNTVIAAAIVNLARQKDKRVLFCVPALSLINQTVERFRASAIFDVGVVQGQHEMTDGTQPVQVCSIQTLARREIPKADLVIIDECHVMFKLYDTWMNDPEWSKVPFVGLTATPWAKGMGAPGRWDRLIIGTTTEELINLKHLSDFKCYAPAHPDLSGVKTKLGDYEMKGLGEAMDKNALVADIVSTWLERGENRSTICFAVNRVHAKHIETQFKEAGVSVEYMDAFTDLEERAAIVDRFAKGDTKIICNVGVLTTGFDADVRCIILARPTKSEILYTQMIGRGLRTANGKDNCLVLDHSDTTLRLGFVTDIHKSELHDGVANRATTERKAPLPKECSECHFLKPPKMVKCPACGFQPKPQNKVEAQDGELYEIGRNKQIKTTAPTPQMQQRWFSELVKYAEVRGYKNGWAAYAFKDKFGTFPPNWLEHKPASLLSPEVSNWITARNIRNAKSKFKVGIR